MLKVDLDGDTKFTWSIAVPTLRVKTGVAESFDDALGDAWAKFLELRGAPA